VQDDRGFGSGFFVSWQRRGGGDVRAGPAGGVWGGLGWWWGLGRSQDGRARGCAVLANHETGGVVMRISTVNNLTESPEA